MKEQFVTYEIALELKYLGFNEKCFGSYETKDIIKEGYLLHYPFDGKLFSNQILAPLWQQVEEWFREKYSICIVYEDDNNVDNAFHKRCDGYTFYVTEHSFCVIGKSANGCHKDYNKMREIAVLKVIDFIKNNPE